MDLAELFPSGDYRFHLSLRRAEPREFFASRDASGGVLAERRHWLTEAPERYAGLAPEGEPLLAEFAGRAGEWGLVEPSLIGLGCALEPDTLFLSSDAEGRFRLRGGVLCFPTGWALQEKLGETLDFIHGVVPGLNAALGSPIHQFLAKLKPGVAFLRDNWGIAATNELNLHPARGLPAPQPPVALDRLWLRVEHQALMALPETRGIVFGIRIALHRLDTIAGTPAAAGLRRALETMPPALAAYKRLDTVRVEIATRL
ncbi:MAG: DUF3445 domain-containing protein [Opitutaceae bacterium]|nr:DUF3445 domain-containing protein [Opitutaceae bacterium]